MSPSGSDVALPRRRLDISPASMAPYMYRTSAWYAQFPPSTFANSLSILVATGYSASTHSRAAEALTATRLARPPVQRRPSPASVTPVRGSSLYSFVFVPS